MIELRDYQRNAVKSLYAYFEIRSGNPLLVIPTGGGKSIIQAVFIKDVLEQWPDQRILLLTHVKELIEQNFLNLLKVWPQADAGIYSASFNRRDVGQSITFAGIQSVYSKAWDLGRYDLIIVDEAHLIPPRGEGMYRTFFADSKRINPLVKIIGLTATPYRLKQGMLHDSDDSMFTDIAFNLPIQRLLDDGHLAPLTTEPVRSQTDVTGVGKRGGEFIPSQLEKAVDIDRLTRAAVGEMVALAHDRKQWLVFCAGVNHALHVRDALRTAGITAEAVSGKTPKAERDAIIHQFKSGAVRAITNVNVLTTGFDAPDIDMIAFLRPTESPGLYIQMAGRGMRTAPGKTDCLVLDFANNIFRHGPIDDVIPPQSPKKSRKSSEPILKQCPECEAFVYTAVRKCPDCDYDFPMSESDKHNETASRAPILSTDAEYIKEFDITNVTYRKHTKEGKPPSMRVDYYSGMNRVASEWVCIEHDGYAKQKAIAWVNARIPWEGPKAPILVDPLLFASPILLTPKSITIDTRGKYDRIVDYQFDDAAGEAAIDSKPESDFEIDREHAHGDAVQQVRTL